MTEGTFVLVCRGIQGSACIEPRATTPIIVYPRLHYVLRISLRVVVRAWEGVTGARWEYCTVRVGRESGFLSTASGVAGP